MGGGGRWGGEGEGGEAIKAGRNRVHLKIAADDKRRLFNLQTKTLYFVLIGWVFLKFCLNTRIFVDKNTLKSCVYQAEKTLHCVKIVALVRGVFPETLSKISHFLF